MKTPKLLLVIAGMLAFPAAAQSDDGAAEPVEVMVLGMYHFANPGLDAVNMEVDDVLAPRRQREIEILAATLAEWQPTRIAVENEASAPSFELDGYAEYGDLVTSQRSESVQVGYRVARMLGHEAVFGYDERGGPDEPDYFPMGKVMEFAKAAGQDGLIEELLAELQETVAAEQARLPEQSIAESLIFHNREDIVGAQHDRLYYSLLSIGNGNEQPGAELNAYWYMRNAKMFAKLDMIAEPGDRVLVLAGSGHATWLKHFVRRMPGYELADPLPLLQKAAALSEDTER
ncbi:DUF5694 domain-containing protein [Erythrobacter rubeus]|uniref:TraB/GumN family protein n=1 Tax=Erythrobacter rubeus TaxID=2760803 RepID=A0ABR8KUK2_9SPHN|nr:DUF5694 domain-containing protein [Erythrobacter rubeus]MBD2842104.1 hypothetical protein [Erythrobacter rubeus]